LGVLHQTDVGFLPKHFKGSDIKVLAMDMDSTLINIECIDEIADAVGKKKEVSEITEAAMRGEIKDFSESLRRRVALLKGVPAAALDEVFSQRLRLNPGAKELISGAHAKGIHTLLVSGGFTFFTYKLEAQLNLSETHANQLEIVDGFLTGQVLGNIVDGAAKAAYVEARCLALGANKHAAITMGDGSNDLLMMHGAGLSIAYRAKPIVKEKADLAFDHVGLDACLDLL
jgi:phosphoserine phosphatase